MGLENAKEELKSTLNDSILNNVADFNDTLIKDKSTAIEIAECFLFKIYGQGKIKEQRPYEVYHIDNYWVISGTMEKNYFGGTFLIIIDARNSKIIRISHGK
jgi:hypothetical protein